MSPKAAAIILADAMRKHPAPDSRTEELGQLLVTSTPDEATDAMTALPEIGPPIDPSQPNPYFDASYWVGERKAEPIRSLVKNLITADGVTFIAGVPNAGKSAVAINLAVALATGAPFAGRKTRTPNNAGCAVVYVAAEAPGSLPGRFDAMKGMMFIDADAILPIRIMPKVPSLTDKTLRAIFIDALKRVVPHTEKQFGMPVGAIIVDTFSRAFPMTDENSAAEANAVVNALNELGDSINVARIVVHHFGKNVAAGMRGSSALHAAADDELWLTVGDEGEARYIGEMAHEKSRNFPVGTKFSYRLRSAVVSTDEDGDDITSVFAVFNDAAAEKKNKEAMEERMADLRHDFMHYAFDHGSISRGDAMTELGMTKYEFTRCYEYLRDKLKLVVEDPSSKAWVLTPAGTKKVKAEKRRRKERDEAFDKGTDSPKSGQ
jgi:hypothetical protein